MYVGNPIHINLYHKSLTHTNAHSISPGLEPILIIDVDCIYIWLDQTKVQILWIPVPNIHWPAIEFISWGWWMLLELVSLSLCFRVGEGGTRTGVELARATGNWFIITSSNYVMDKLRWVRSAFDSLKGEFANFHFLIHGFPQCPY